MKTIRTTTQGKEYYLKLKRFGFWAATERFEKTFAGEIQNIAEIVDTLRNYDKARCNYYAEKNNGYWCSCWEGKGNGFEWKLSKNEINEYWEIRVLIYKETKEESNTEETEPNTNAKETVIEFCSNCETEIEMMRWDVKTRGYKAFCPVCGERLMLCDECQHRGEDGELLNDCDYDSQSDTCRFNSEGRR